MQVGAEGSAAPLASEDFGAHLALPPHPLSAAHLVSPPQYGSVAYHANVLDAAAASRLVHAIDASPSALWVELRGRRLQQHGGQPLAQGGVEGAAPLPPHLAGLCARLVDAGIFPAAFPPNHVLVNDYAQDEGILPHSDGPRYHPCVATLSLLDAAVMRFSVLFGREREGERGGQVLGELVLRSGSLVVTWGQLYERYAHAIAEGRANVLGGSVWNSQQAGACSGDTVERAGRRVSITIRHVL